MSAILRFPTKSVTMTVEESDSPMRIALRRAAKSGWSLNPPETELPSDVLVLQLALDSNFWQSLATAEGWPEWESHRQDFIESLADGGNAASFFSQLLK
jgi:hypothetical protein